jgi:phytoene synthase
MILDQNKRQIIRGRYQNILKSWLKQVCDLDDVTKGPLDIRVITALQNTVGKSDMGITQWEELAGALKMDILESPMRTWNEFINYCEGATVSPASIYIYISASSYNPSEGYTYNLEKSPRYYAKNLAIYCYIVHILRDLAKDAEGSTRLITIPDDVLKEAELTRKTIQNAVVNKSQKIFNLAQILSEKAIFYKEKGHKVIEELYPVIGNREALALKGLIGVYDKLFVVAKEKSTDFIVNGPKIEKEIRGHLLGIKN